MDTVLSPELATKAKRGQLLVHTAAPPPPPPPPLQEFRKTAARTKPTAKILATDIPLSPTTDFMEI